MATEKIEMHVPAGFERAVSMTREELEERIRLMAALKMFELGQISSGRAAELAGMPRVEFLDTCGRYHVSIFNYPPDEAAEETRRDMETLKKLR